MIFALVKISGVRIRNHEYAYRSTVMQRGASAKSTKVFANEDDMIAVVNPILAKQKRRDDVRQVLDQIRHGDYYFFDLDLTNQEAESLGWKSSQSR